jgi:hypothetical protein
VQGSVPAASHGGPPWPENPVCDCHPFRSLRQAGWPHLVICQARSQRRLAASAALAVA